MFKKCVRREHVMLEDWCSWMFLNILECSWCFLFCALSFLAAPLSEAQGTRHAGRQTWYLGCAGISWDATREATWEGTWEATWEATWCNEELGQLDQLGHFRGRTSRNCQLSFEWSQKSDVGKWTAGYQGGSIFMDPGDWNRHFNRSCGAVYKQFKILGMVALAAVSKSSCKIFPKQLRDNPSGICSLKSFIYTLFQPQKLISVYFTATWSSERQSSNLDRHDDVSTRKVVSDDSTAFYPTGLVSFNDKQPSAPVLRVPGARCDRTEGRRLRKVMSWPLPDRCSNARWARPQLIGLRTGEFGLLVMQ